MMDTARMAETMEAGTEFRQIFEVVLMMDTAKMAETIVDVGAKTKDWQIFEVVLMVYTTRMAETKRRYWKLRRMTMSVRHPDREEQRKSSALHQYRRRTMEEQRRMMEEQRCMMEEQRETRVPTGGCGHQTRGLIVDWPQRLKQKYCRLLHSNKDMARFESRAEISGM